MDHAMMVRADAKAIGMVTATRPGGERRKPRSYARASECISYYNRDKSDAKLFAPARAERKQRNYNRPAVTKPTRTMAWDLPRVVAD